MRYIMIDALTAAKTSYIGVTDKATVVSTGLGSNESIAINILVGTTYVPLIDNEVAVTLTSVKPHIILSGESNYQFVKGVTSSAVTLEVIGNIELI